MTKIDKKELKSPDAFQAELQKGFQWTTQHSRIVGVALLAFILVGAGISAKAYLDSRKEQELQSKYFLLEKKLSEKQQAFQAGSMPPPPVDPKNKDAKTPEAPKGEKASGNFEQDYGPIAQELNQFIQEAPKTKAAKMAALNLSDVQMEYQQFAPAQDILSKVQTDSKDLLSGMVSLQLGTAQANANDCNSAILTWQKVLSNNSAKALHGAAKLKQGLCYESLKDLTKAEQLYTEAMNDDKESVTAKAADKYLRLLQTAKK